MNSEYNECIKQLKREIKFLEKEVRNCVRERDFKYAKHYQKAIWRTQIELKRLVAFTEKNYYLDEQEIDEALVELNEGQIESFSIVLQPYQDFYLNFSCLNKNQILCELPTEEELLQAYIYGYVPKFKKAIMALGFKETGLDKRLSIQFQIPANQSCIEIKSILSHLMFNILYIEIKQPAHLIKRNKEDLHLKLSPATVGPPRTGPQLKDSVRMGS